MRTNCNNWIIEALKGWIARAGIDIHQAPLGDVNKMAACQHCRNIGLRSGDILSGKRIETVKKVIFYGQLSYGCNNPVSG